MTAKDVLGFMSLGATVREYYRADGNTLKPRYRLFTNEGYLVSQIPSSTWRAVYRDPRVIEAPKDERYWGSTIYKMKDVLNIDALS